MCLALLHVEPAKSFYLDFLPFFSINHHFITSREHATEACQLAHMTPGGEQ
jgi:hypothetical protein